MVNNQKISIVLATYNGREFIRDQIKSIVSQTVKPYEILFCDDNSSDDTKEIIEDAMKNVHISYQILSHTNNVGVLANFWKGIQASKGDLIFFCDQDDYWLPKKIESSLRCFEDKDVMLAFCNASITDGQLRKIGYSLWDTIDFTPNKDYKSSDYQKELLKRNIFTGMCMAFRKSMFKEESTIPKGMLHDEYVGWLAVSKGKVAIIDEELVLYRQHGKNVVGAANNKRFEGISKTKEYIENSSRKELEKVDFLLKIGLLHYEDSYVNEYIRFVKFRASLASNSRCINMVKCIYNVITGRYRRYSSKTDRAFLKDMFFLIL